VALIDTGPLVALAIPHDPRHATAWRAVNGLPGPLTTTWAVATEVLHFLGDRAGGWHGQAPFVALVRGGRLSVADFTLPLGLRSLELIEQYADAPMDLADASLVALGEARWDYRVVTFDADFRFFRAAGGLSFTVLDGSS